MSGPSRFDASIYVRSPNVSIATGIALAKSLVRECPKSMPASVKKACKKLSAVCEAAQGAWADRQREMGALSDGDSRLIDQEADTVWGALRGRLRDFASLPFDRYPRAQRASELVVVLFGADELNFLKTKFTVQYETMDTILKRIGADNLENDINELAGPEFLDQIRHVHPRYEAMVRTMIMREEGSGQNLLEHVRNLQRAVVEYAIKVCGTVDEDDDPQSAVVARRALLPIEKFRADVGTKVGKSGAEGGGGEAAPVESGAQDDVG